MKFRTSPQSDIPATRRPAYYFLRFAPYVLLFSIVFALVTAFDWPDMAAKDLYFHDESSNSAVAANLTRSLFPPMIRIHSLVDNPGNWMEGPHWQHIPPLFAYVPLPLFALDGRVTIEMKRLAYAIVLLITGICFIVSVSGFDRSRLAAISATLAAIFWIETPFTRMLVAGTAFGTSDIVLAATLVFCLWALLWYLENPSKDRVNYSVAKIAFIAVIMALPVVAKNILGLMPFTTFCVLLLWDRKKPDLKFLLACAIFGGVILSSFGPLYFISPDTFRREIVLPIDLMSDFEGWGRPWHFFLTDYLPRYYLRHLTPLFLTGFLLSVRYVFSKRLDTTSRTVLVFCGGWFVWNLIAVSFLGSKAPDFIFQSYLPALFFSIYGPLRWLETDYRVSGYVNNLLAKGRRGLQFITPALCVLALAAFAYLFYTIHQSRNSPYAYKSDHEQFYRFGEAEQANAAGPSDLFILDSSADDCWFRYYILFLTGAEARTLNEVLAYNVAAGDVQAKFAKAHFVLPVSDTPPEIATTTTIRAIDHYQVLSFDSRALKPNYTEVLNSWVALSPNNRHHRPAASCNWPPFLQMR